ncbi:MAG TPA: alkaline phosphatase family protein [Microthrixaceae bacterium]|nr:alkaline phosphatase family protein [Microthrixaceae bacterium]
MHHSDRRPIDPNRRGNGDDSGIQKLENNLTDKELADRVEMVLRPLGGSSYRAAAVDGSVEFERVPNGDTYDYRVTSSTGRNPLSDQDPDRFLTYESEVAEPFPDRVGNSYPHAFDSIAQFFDSVDAPDMVITHTAAHDTDGNLGQHGSLAVTQARAPFIAAGAGLKTVGELGESARMVDVAPTIARLLDLDVHPNGVGATGERRADALLARQDGNPIDSVLSGDRADHVFVILLDGCNANLLHDVIDAGEAPNLAELAGAGTALRQGLFASLPTATLANHTTAVTGVHPGHSGILNHTWLNRRTGVVPELLSMEEMFWATKYLSTDVETIFEAIERSRPGAFTSAGFEFCDRSATMSSFAMVREGAATDLPEMDRVRHMDHSAAAQSSNYGFMSSVDHLSMTHTIECWDRVAGNPLPTLSWCSFSLTDEAAHESGPHGELARAAVRDSDARVGELVNAVEGAGAFSRTAFLVISDHGMEQANPKVVEPWGEALRATGVAHRDIGGGLIYLAS